MMMMAVARLSDMIKVTRTEKYISKATETLNFINLSHRIPNA